MDGHLVTVEVGVIRCTHQRMQLERTSLDENGLKRLNAETVQRRRTVEEHGVLFNDDLKRVPNFCALLIDHFLCGFNVVGNAVLDELLHHEGAEQLDSHFLWNAALIYLKIGSDNDNTSAGVVYTLAEQILAEASLLTLEHIRQGFEGT